MMPEAGATSAGTHRKLPRSPMMLLVLLIESHLGLSVVVAAGKHQPGYNHYHYNDNGSRWTTTTSPVTSTSSGAFVFRDCGKHAHAATQLLLGRIALIRGVTAYSHQTFPRTICRSVGASVCPVHCGKRRTGSGWRLAS